MHTLESADKTAPRAEAHALRHVLKRISLTEKCLRHAYTRTGEVLHKRCARVSVKRRHQRGAPNPKSGRKRPRHNGLGIMRRNIRQRLNHTYGGRGLFRRDHRAELCGMGKKKQCQKPCAKGILLFLDGKKHLAEHLCLHLPKRKNISVLTENAHKRTPLGHVIFKKRTGKIKIDAAISPFFQNTHKMWCAGGCQNKSRGIPLHRAIGKKRGNVPRKQEGDLVKLVRVKIRHASKLRFMVRNNVFLFHLTPPVFSHFTHNRMICQCFLKKGLFFLSFLNDTQVF